MRKALGSSTAEDHRPKQKPECSALCWVTRRGLERLPDTLSKSLDAPNEMEARGLLLQARRSNRSVKSEDSLNIKISEGWKQSGGGGGLGVVDAEEVTDGTMLGRCD